MRKLNYFFSVLIAAMFVVTSCTEYAPSDSVEALRETYQQKMSADIDAVVANTALMAAQAEVEMAKAKTEEAKAKLEEAKAATEAAKAKEIEANAKILEAQALLEAAKVDFQKAMTAEQESKAALAAIEVQVAQAENAEARKLAEEELKQAQAESDRMALQVQLAEKEIAAADVEIQQATEALEAAKIANEQAQTQSDLYKVQLQKDQVELATAIAREEYELQQYEAMLAEAKIQALTDSLTAVLAYEAKMAQLEDADDQRELATLQSLENLYNSAKSDYTTALGLVSTKKNALNIAKLNLNSAVYFSSPALFVTAERARLEALVAKEQADLEDVQASLDAAKTIKAQDGVEAKIAALNAEIKVLEDKLEAWDTRMDEIVVAYQVEELDAAVVDYAMAVIAFQNVINPVAPGQTPNWVYSRTDQGSGSVLNGNVRMSYYNWDFRSYNRSYYPEDLANNLYNSYSTAPSWKDTPREALASVRSSAANDTASAYNSLHTMLKEDATYAFVKRRVDSMSIYEAALVSAIEDVFNSYSIQTGQYDQNKINDYNTLIVEYYTYCNSIRRPNSYDSEKYLYMSYGNYPRVYTYNIYQNGSQIRFYYSYSVNGSPGYNYQYLSSSVQAKAYLDNDAKWRKEYADQRLQYFVNAGWDVVKALNIDEKQAAYDDAMAVWNALIDDAQWISDYNAARADMATKYEAFKLIDDANELLSEEYSTVYSDYSNTFVARTNLQTIVGTELAKLKEAYEISNTNASYSFGEMLDEYFEEMITDNESALVLAQKALSTAQENLANFEKGVSNDTMTDADKKAYLEALVATAEEQLQAAEAQLALAKEVYESAKEEYETQLAIVYPAE